MPSEAADLIRRMLFTPLRALRCHPVWFWTVTLLYFTLGLGTWTALVQPAYDRWLSRSELVLLAVWFGGLIILLAVDFDREQARRMSVILGKSRWMGALISLTTLIVLFFAAEYYLRIFQITTDQSNFTLAGHHWQENFNWDHLNTLGYRDHEPQTGGGLMHIAIVGDSFVMGQGINDLDDTFAQQLEARLGACCDVNVIAREGWDTQSAFQALQQYPITPDILIVSYYLNDIENLMSRSFEDQTSRYPLLDNPTMFWIVFHFFVPNCLYYNLTLTTSDQTADAVSGYIAAHMDDAMWLRQAETLRAIKAWADERDAALIVLLWPHITAIEASQPAVQRVGDFMIEQGVTVVDMSAPLRAQPTAELIVNRLDTHPGIAAHRLAAGALYPVVRNLIG
jgi:hypothetical protein